MVQALVDNSCLCSGIINKSLATSMALPRIPISPRSLETVEDSTVDKPVVDCITYVSLDLDGFVTTKLWLYVVPGSTYQIILGKKWLEDQDALIDSKEQKLELQRSGAVIYSVKRWRQNLKMVSRPRSTPINTISAMLRQVPVCKASLEDINKALRSKASLSIEEARKRHPREVH